MGMYDNLKISINKLPISNEDKKRLGDNPGWQTKDFECILSTAYIEDNGDLKFNHQKFGWDDTKKNGFGTMGVMTIDKEEMIHLKDYHGFVNFYTHCRDGDEWFEFNAKYTDGKLSDIVRVGEK